MVWDSNFLSKAVRNSWHVAAQVGRMRFWTFQFLAAMRAEGASMELRIRRRARPYSERRGGSSD